DQNDSFVQITISSTQNFKTIATMFKVPVYVLSDINKIPPQTILTEGMTVKLPFKRKEDNAIAILYTMLTKKTVPTPSKTVSKATVKTIVKTYKVRRGDNLTIIAKRHKSSVGKILADNKNLKLKSRLFPGLIIFIK
ncbi:MAG: LysM domain-containing protein, partial [Alphaproteobacteria bacterium]